MRADRVSRVVDSDWIIRIAQRSPDDFGRCFPHSRYMRWRSPCSEKKRPAPKRKCKFNEDWKRDFAWIAKLADCDMAQCNLCATDVSISPGGRTDVRRSHGPGVIPCQESSSTFSRRYYKLPVVIIMLILVKHIPDVIYNINAM